MISRAIHIAALKFAVFQSEDLVGASVSGDILNLTFNVNVNVLDITGITLTSDGGALSVISLIYDTDTKIASFQLNRTPIDTETVSVSINGQTNQIYTSTSNLRFAGVTDYDVELNIGIEFINEDTYINEDTFI